MKNAYRLGMFLLIATLLSMVHFTLFVIFGGFLGQLGQVVAKNLGAARGGVLWWCVMILNSLACGAVFALFVQFFLRKKGERFCLNMVYNVSISIVAFGVMVALGCLMQTTQESVAVGSLFYLSVMLNAGWGFYLFAPVVRIRIFNALLFMGLFVWGCMLYFCSPIREGNNNPSVIERQIEAPNRTVAAFFPSRGGFESIAKSNDTRLRLHYFTFHSAVLFYVALLTFAIFGRGIVNRVRKWVTVWRRLNVFWGRSDSGLLLARNITGTTVGEQVFFMLQQRSGDGDEWRTLTHDIDRMDAMWSFTYDSNAVESDVNNDTLSQAKGRRHFFMDESAHVNVSRADRIVKILRNHKPQLGIKGCWDALRAGMILRWVVDCKRWWIDRRRWWKWDWVDGTSCREALPRSLQRVLRHCKLWRRHPKRFKKLRGEERAKWCKSATWDKPFLYVRIEAPADELLYQTWAANVRDVVTPVLIRESQLIAKDLMRRHPLLKIPRIYEKIDRQTAEVKVERINILLIGFGATGQDVLNEIICNGQFVKSYDSEKKSVPVPLHVDVVEQDEKVIEEYCVRHPLATRHLKFGAVKDEDRCNCYDVGFVEHTCIDGDTIDAVMCGDKRYEINLDKECVRIEGKNFDDWFIKRLETGNQCPYDRIIVCLKGDEKTLAIAEKIVEFARRHGVYIGPGVVFARVKDPARNRYLPQGKIRTPFTRGVDQDVDSSVALFGDLSSIYTFNRINVEIVDTMAKVLNNRYGTVGQHVGMPEDVGTADVQQRENWEMKRDQKWEESSFFDQLSSRAAAEGQRNLLLLRGMDYRENVKDEDVAEEVSYDEVDRPMNDAPFGDIPILRTLAINEHLRWNAFHLMMGYRPWKILDRDDDARADVPEEIRPAKIKANQLATIGKHADIIEFERLPDVNMRLKEWAEGRSSEELGLRREDFVGLAPFCAQAYDIAFCQIIGQVAKEVNRINDREDAGSHKIVRFKPPRL